MRTLTAMLGLVMAIYLASCTGLDGPAADTEEDAGAPPLVPEVSCTTSRGSYTIFTVCGDYAWSAWHPYAGAKGATLEVFAVGAGSYNVFHIWQRYAGDTAWSGWYTLGGIVDSRQHSGVFGCGAPSSSCPK